MAWWDEIERIAGNTVDLLAQPFRDPPAPAPLPSSTDPNYDYSGDPTISNGAPLANPTYAMSGGDSSVGSSVTSSAAGSQEGNISRIMAVFGVDRAYAQAMLQRAALGDTAIQKSLASMGIEPYATQYAPKDSSGGGGGSAGRVLFPDEVAQIKAETDRALAQAGVYQGQSRQINALFDPNYADGALITLPDGTQRINGTEIIIDSRVRGDFKPVANAPGYFVDPVTGTVIDTNGNQIRREELQETIRSNQAQETNQRNRLALDTERDITQLNQNAAITENEQKLKSALETNRLNLDAFSSEGNLNIGATNAETSRLNALTGRTSAAGELALNQQGLDDARTRSIIELGSNPQNFVQREYETRALQAPAGIDSPAYRENTAANQAIAQLLTVPNVDNLLPTYQAPRFSEPTLPNASIPRATAPTYQTPPPAPAISTPSAPALAPVNNTPATQQQASDHFRSLGVPDWALTPLGYAEGTSGTKEREFIAGDPQMDGMPNPEIIEVNNPAPDTSVSVTPIKDMMPGSHMMPDGQQMPNDQMAGNMDIQVLVDSIVQEVMERLGGLGEESSIEDDSLTGYARGTKKPGRKTGLRFRPDATLDTTQIDDRRGMDDWEQLILRRMLGMPGYAYGTDWNQWQDNSQPNSNQGLADNLFNRSAASRPNPNQGITRPAQRPQQSKFNSMSSPNPMPAPVTPTPTNNVPAPNPNANVLAPNWREILTNVYTSLQDRINNPPEWASNLPWMQPNNSGNGGANIQPVPNNNPWGIDLSRLNLPMFAQGTPDRQTLIDYSNAYNQKLANTPTSFAGFSGVNPTTGQATGGTSTSAPNNASGRFGPKDSKGNYLGKVTSNTDQSIQNMPNVRYAQDYGNQTGYNQLGVGNVGAAFGVNLPDVGGLNLRQLNDIRLDPDAWGTLASLYSSGNRNLEAIYNRVLANAPRGNAIPFGSMIRT